MRRMRCGCVILAQGWQKRNNNSRKKREYIYIKKTRTFALSSSFFSFFSSFLLLATHNYSEILTYQARGAMLAQRVKEKRLSFSSLFSLFYAHARVYTHTHIHPSDKDLVFNSEFKRKKNQSLLIIV